MSVRKDVDNGKFNFPEGFDNEIKLKDLLEDEVDEKYYISQDKVDKLIEKLKDKKGVCTGVYNQNDGFTEKEVACTLDANYYKGLDNHASRTGIMQVGMLDIKGNEQVRRVDSSDGLCPTLNTMGGGNRQPKIIEEKENPIQVKHTELPCILDDRDKGFGIKTSDICLTQRANRQGLKITQGCSTRTRSYINQPEQLEVRKDEVSNSITTVQKDSMALETNIGESPSPELVGGIGEINFGKQYRQGNRVYNADKTTMCLLSQPVGNTGGNSYLYLVKDGEEIKDSFIEKKYKEFIDKYGYMPEMFNPYNCSEITDISPTTTTQCGSTTSSATVLIKDIWYRIRKLTPLECWRLMGFDDEDFYIAQKGLNETFYKGKDRSSSQLYKMAGNSIVVDVLYYIYLELYKAMPYLFEDIKLGSFFSGIGAFEKAIERLLKEINQNELSEVINN